jgi:hypothetical protein
MNRKDLENIAWLADFGLRVWTMPRDNGVRHGEQQMVSAVEFIRDENLPPGHPRLPLKGSAISVVRGPDETDVGILRLANDRTAVMHDIRQHRQPLRTAGEDTQP